ncbi:MAG: RNA polymerase sigma factor [Planctomycetota bacterium]|nr:RNA polymerase sigma factor [Planctomycetota bacterium]
MPGTTTSVTRSPIGHHALAELARGTRPGDCAQDVLLSALVKPPAPRTSLRTWFQGALHLRSLETARSEGSRRTRELRVARPESSHDQELELAELRELLQTGLAELEPATRAILRAHYWDGMSLTQIADRRGASLGSVKRRHALGLAHLRQRLGDPAIDRRDWATLGWSLAAAAGLVLAGALGLRAASDQAAHAPTSSVAMVALVPSQVVASAEPLLPAHTFPATKLDPSQPIPGKSQVTQVERGAGPESVPMQRLTPALPLQPTRPERGLPDGLIELN